MKRTVCILLCLAFAAFTPCAIAEDINITPTSSGTATTDVTCTIDPDYIVVIPSAISLDEVNDASTNSTHYMGTGTVSVNSLRLEKNQTLDVTLTSDFEMETTRGAKMPYTVKALGGSIASGGTVASFVTGSGEYTSTMYYSADSPLYAGDYSDNVTFTVSVED